MDKNTLIVLGSGTSTGIPMLGCECEVCSSTRIENKRSRSSILLQIEGKNIIIDTTPDMRTQLLREKINKIDAAIITHDHADHVHGIDDLRPFTFVNDMEVATHQLCAENLKIRFPYIFKNRATMTIGGGIPKLNFKIVQENFELMGIRFNSALLPHGRTQTLSINHKKFAYIIDCQSVAQDWISKLIDQKLELLIIDCVRYRKHDTHLCFEDALRFIDLIKPKRAGLIHISHEIEHFELVKKIDQIDSKIDIFPVVDGMKLSY